MSRVRYSSSADLQRVFPLRRGSYSEFRVDDENGGERSRYNGYNLWRVGLDSVRQLISVETRLQALQVQFNLPEGLTILQGCVGYDELYIDFFCGLNLRTKLPLLKKYYVRCLGEFVVFGAND